MSEQPFQTLRSLVGMTMGARKRAARRWLWPDDNRRDALRMFRDMAAEWTNNGEKYEYRLARKPYRLGQKVRPCPGCEQCTDSPRLQVMGYARRIGGSVNMSRIYIHWRQRSEYSLSIDCSGSVIVAGGVTKDEAWNAMRGYMREQHQLDATCDGSGVLPAKKAKVK